MRRGVPPPKALTHHPSAINKARFSLTASKTFCSLPGMLGRGLSYSTGIGTVRVLSLLCSNSHPPPAMNLLNFTKTLFPCVALFILIGLKAAFSEPPQLPREPDFLLRDQGLLPRGNSIQLFSEPRKLSLPVESALEGNRRATIISAAAVKVKTLPDSFRSSRSRKSILPSRRGILSGEK